MATEEVEVVVENTISRGTAEDTVGNMAMVDTKGQPAEPKPMVINTKLRSKTKWEAEPEDVIQPPDGGDSKK